MADTYSNDNDVEIKYAHLTIPTELVVSNFRDDAYNLINVNLRKLYAIPIDSTNETDLGVLKLIESHLAAGNIILAVSSVHESQDVHKYGKSLVEYAEKILSSLVEEKMILSGATRDTIDSSDVVDPAVIHGSAADDYATFDRPMSGIENDAIEGKVDAEKYNELEDTKTI